MSLYSHYSEKELEILQARARRVERAGDSIADELDEALLVHLRGEVYALPIDSVLAVYEDSLITPLPCTPPFIAGLVNLRGHLVIVLDLATILGVPGEDKTDRNTVIVVAGDGFNVGLRVSQASEVGTIDTRQLTPISTLRESKQARYLSGVMPDGAALLNLSAVVNDADLIIGQEMETPG